MHYGKCLHLSAVDNVKHETVLIHPHTQYRLSIYKLFRTLNVTFLPKSDDLCNSDAFVSFARGIAKVQYYIYYSSCYEMGRLHILKLIPFYI